MVFSEDANEDFKGPSSLLVRTAAPFRSTNTYSKRARVGVCVRMCAYASEKQQSNKKGSKHQRWAPFTSLG